MSGLQSANLRGVIFDLDGTLYPLGGNLKLRMLARLWDRPGLLWHLSGSRESVRGRDFESGAAFDAALFTELSRRAGVTPEDASQWFETRFLPGFVSVLASSCRARPGIEELATRLRERGFKLAVLSDYGAVDERLEALGIAAQAFDLRCSASESGSLKPSSRPFAMVAEGMGLSPAQIVAVGDRDDMDRAGSEAAGVHYLGLASPRSSSPHDWARVCEILNGLGRSPATGS